MNLEKIVIVGAGAVGCASAYVLAERLPGKKITLIEKNNGVGEETSGQAAGLVGQVRTSLDRTRLAMRSVETFRRLQSSSFPAGWSEVGSIRVSLSPERSQEFSRMQAIAEQAGLETQLISPSEAQERWPKFCFDQSDSILWCPSDGFLQPSDLTQSFAQNARTLGVEVRTQCGLRDLIMQSGRVVGVETDQGKLDCDLLIVAAGAHSWHIARLAGLDLPIVPVRHEFFVTVDDVSLEGYPVARIPDIGLYLRPEVGALLCGGWEPNAEYCDPKSYDLGHRLPGIAEDWDVLAKFAADLSPHFPPVDDLGVRAVFKGWPTFTPDGRFIIGPSRHVPGLAMAAGCNAHGVSGSAGMAWHLAESLLSPAPSDYVQSLSPDRFGETIAKRESWPSQIIKSRDHYQTYYHLKPDSAESIR